MNEKVDRRLAKVTRVSLGIEQDHCLLTAYIHLQYDGGCCQGFGGYRLDCHNKGMGCAEGTAAGCDWLLKVLEVFGVEDWNDIVGEIVWVDTTGGGMGTTILAIESPSFNTGKRFDIREWRRRWFPEREDEK